MMVKNIFFFASSMIIITNNRASLVYKIDESLWVSLGGWKMGFFTSMFFYHVQLGRKETRGAVYLPIQLDIT